MAGKDFAPLTAAAAREFQVTVGDDQAIGNANGQILPTGLVSKIYDVTIENGSPFKIVQHREDLKTSGTVFGYDKGGAPGGFYFQYAIFGYGTSNADINLNVLVQVQTTVSVDSTNNIIVENNFGAVGSSRNFMIQLSRMGQPI